MPNKLTTEEVNKRLMGRNIKLIEEYKGSDKRHNFQCEISQCLHIWTTTAQSIWDKKSGCPKCAALARSLSNEDIDRALIGRNIKRIENYSNIKTPLKFQCEVNGCFHIWKARPDSIIGRRRGGCPECFHRSQRLTNNIIDADLQGRYIKRLSDYTGGKDAPMSFQCEIINCLHCWTTTPSSVRRGSGCPKCAGHLPFTNEIIDERLKGSTIKRMGDCITSTHPIAFQCLIDKCNYIWLANPAHITPTPNTKTKKTGCPKCARNAKLTNEVIDERLKDKNIKRLGQYINNSTPIFFKCLIENCQNEWMTSPASIITNETGCPKCARGKNEKLVGLILEGEGIIVEPQKLINKIIMGEQRKLLIDYYLPQFNTIIEYNGEQHYRPVCFGGISKQQATKCFIKGQERDQYLQKLCTQNNIQLIWIDGRKYKTSKLKTYLLNQLIPQLKK